MNPTPPYTPPPGMPPMPRDHDQASMSELIPFSSKKINLLRSPLTMFLLLAAVLAPLIIVMADSLGQARTVPDAMRTFVYISFAAVFFVVFTIGLLIYFYARPGRPFLPYFWGFLLIFLLMIPGMFGIPFVLDLFILLFRSLPGTDPFGLTQTSGVPATFFAHFVGAGLMEEAFKAIPILIGFMVALKLQRRPGPPSGLANFLAIRGPLDAVLLGVFAGAAFILVETAGQYLPGTAMRVAQETRSLEAGLTQALLLYFPRVIGGAVGHIAYSAVFGYFIGLALLRRKQMVPLIVGGWLLSSWLHALWNTAGTIDPSGYFYFVAAAIKALVLVGVVLKARQLHFSRYGGSGDTMGSIVIDRSGGGREMAPAMPVPGYPPVPAPFAGYAPPPAAAPFPGYGSPPTAYGGPGPQPPQPFAGYASNAPPAVPAQDPAPGSETIQQPVALDIAGSRFALEAGMVVDLAALPALAGRGAGMRGDVVAHPSRPGVLGLRNSGGWPWTVQLRDGTTQQIDTGQNIRLAPGVRIHFGGDLIGDVVARG